MMLAVAVVVAQPVVATDNPKAEHGGEIFHAFELEVDYGVGLNDFIGKWDLDGWVGGDVHKLWLKSEGEWVGDKNEQSEFWTMYSLNVGTFWDEQIGIRYDITPKSTAYLVVGFNGLAPYFLETEVHLFVSYKGQVSARLRQARDLLITQRLILEPYVEVNVSAQDVAAKEVGAGVTDIEIGLQTRYEITRKFVPYFDILYEAKVGKTASIARGNGEGDQNFVASLGVRLMF